MFGGGRKEQTISTPLFVLVTVKLVKHVSACEHCLSQEVTQQNFYVCLCLTRFTIPKKRGYLGGIHEHLRFLACSNILFPSLSASAMQNGIILAYRKNNVLFKLRCTLR